MNRPNNTFINLQNDKEVLLQAVKNNAAALEFVSWNLRNDENFILEVMMHNVQAFGYASLRLKNDKEFA